MQPGLRQAARLVTTQTVTSSIVPVLLAGFTLTAQKLGAYLFDISVPFTVGATGGFRALLSTPAGGSCNLQYSFLNTVTPATDGECIAALNTDFVNALAVAGTHILRMQGVFVNGTTAGTIEFRMAQNTSDALTLSILAGASIQVTQI